MLSEDQVLVSFSIQIAILLVAIIGGVVVACSEKSGSRMCDSLIHSKVSLFIVSLRLGEVGVWVLYFLSMIIFFAYRVAMVPTLYEVQRCFGWIACWSGFIAAFPSLQSGLLVWIFGIPFERRSVFCFFFYFYFLFFFFQNINFSLLYSSFLFSLFSFLFPHFSPMLSLTHTTQIRRTL